MQRRLGLFVLAAGWAVSAHTQAAEKHPTDPHSLVSPSTSVPNAPQASGDIIREIDDPHTGDHWLLLRDPSRPGAPGQMVLATAGTGPNRHREPAGTSLRSATRRPLIPVIHAGDRLIVEESTPMVEARLEAVALGQAISGGPLNVRLAIGGNVVRAIALGPGRAAFAQRAAVQP